MKVLIIPLLAAVTQAASLLLAKIGLTRQRIKLRDYIPGLFLFLTIFSGLSLFKLGHLNYSALAEPDLLVKLVVAIAAAAIWNICFYIGVSKEKANTAEGIMITMPLATITMSWLLDWTKFNTEVAVIAVVATVITTWAYSVRGFKIFDKYSFFLGFAVVFIALENVMVAEVLQTNFISPATLYALRTAVLLIIFYIYYRPNLRRVSHKHLFFLAISALLGAAMMLLRFYGLKDAGVIITSILLILSPALVLILAAVFLHERIKAKRVLAMVVVLSLVLYATLINYQTLLPK